MSLLPDKNAIKREIDRVEDERVLQAIQTILDYANVNTDVWQDKAFLNEMNERSSGFRKQTLAKYTWQETKSAARKSIKVKPGKRT
jgi:hypothetical protein